MPAEPIELTGLTERGALDIVREYDRVRTAAQEHTSLQKQLGDVLKQYIKEHGCLYDGETGLEAFLQARTLGEDVDLVSLAQKHPLDIAQLALVGALKADMKVLKALQGKHPAVDNAMRHRLPGGETSTLQVKKRE